jgi:DNA-binding CsgD family transcriptional regulator
MSPIMVGRGAALDTLRATAEAADVGAGDLPSVALVAGEPGIGKTRLLRELVDGLGPEVMVLSGGAHPGGIEWPFSTVESVLASVVMGERSDSVDGWVELLVATVRDHHCVMLVEDLHWADSQSVAVIDRLTQLPLPRLVLIGSYRPEDLSRRLPGGELLARLERRHAVEQVSLGPLDRSEVGTLLAAMFDHPPTSAVIEAIYQRSGGNPFVIEELVGCCGAEDPRELATMSLPWSLEEAVRDRLEGLGPLERTVVDAAAVAGSDGSFDVLAVVADVEEDELISVLRTLVGRGLLVEPEPDRFEFRHALVRDAVAGQLLGRERRRLHRRALDALERLAPDALVGRARHAAGAGNLDEFVALARRAARDELGRGSSFLALRVADEALMEEPDDVELLGVATEAAWLVGLDEEALGYADRWRHASSDDDPDARVEPLRWRVRLLYEVGSDAELDVELGRLRTLAEQLERAGAGHEGAAARAAVAVAQTDMLQGRTADAVAWADRAEHLATQVGDAAIRLQARVERASALVPEHADEASAELLRVVDEAEAAGCWLVAARGLNNVFDHVPAYTPEGRVLLSRWLVDARRAGFDAMSIGWTALREVEQALGDADQGATRRALQRVSEWVRSHPRYQGWMWSLELELAAEEGRVADARALLERVATFERSKGSIHDTCHHGLAVAMLGHDAAEARRLLTQRVAVALPVTMSAAIDGIATLLYAHEAGVGDDELRELVLPWFDPHPSGRELRAGGVALLDVHGDDPSAAVETLSELIERWNGGVPRYWLATLRTELAQARFASGDRAGALDDVTAALDDLAGWPGWRRDRAHSLRRRFEGRGAPAPDGELTAREREVAVLLAEGLTNSELAARLYISPKTAAVHVSNILMKLQMSSRAEVAAWAVRSGLAGQRVPA